MIRTRRQHSGFTLIEMIVATTIGVLLVTGVYSATQSMTRAARTQSEAAKKGAPLRRAEEIIRHDLHGWMGNAPLNAGIQGEETALLSFTTTSDSIITENAANGGARSSAAVRYIVRPVLGQFELIRVEGPVLLPLLRTNNPPEVEFYDGREWTKLWSRRERPAGIRIVLEQYNIVIRL